MANYINTKPTSSIKRLINFLIDICSIYALTTLIVLSFFTQIDTEFKLNFQYPFYLTFILYYFIMEYTLGQTLGKMITRTKVVNYSTDKISFGKLLIRTLLRLFILEWFSFIAKWPQGWHDSISDTKVIDLKS